jgi:hypothetical protein
MVAFVLVLLSTVSFDGFTATPAWASVEGRLYAALVALGDAAHIHRHPRAHPPLLFRARIRGIRPLDGLMGDDQLDEHRGPALRALSGADRHRVSPGALLHVSPDPGPAPDPARVGSLRLGWDLRHRALPADIGSGARGGYTAVLAIVVGHVIAVYVAHVVALREYRDRRAALRSQLPMLVLMVGYTVVSLWIIAQPIVESR